jgi:hypothetical protein
MLWLIPLVYGAMLLLGLFSQGKQPGKAAWLAPIAHIGLWLAALSSYKGGAMAALSQSMTMSWGLFSVVVIIGCILLNQDNEHSEFLQGGLLVAGALSALWIACLDVKLVTPLPTLKLAATWLIDASGGMLLLLGMLSWKLYLDGDGKQYALSQWLVRLQIVASIFAVSGMLLSLQQSVRLTLLQQGHILFALLAVGGLLLPGQRPDNPNKTTLTLPSSTRLWSLTGALFTIAWALIRLFVVA